MRKRLDTEPERCLLNRRVEFLDVRPSDYGSGDVTAQTIWTRSRRLPVAER